jgi:hypothetical protein
MRYKQKLILLSALAVFLALVYGGALIFDPGRMDSRAAAWAWIDPQWLPQVDRIEITRSGETISLVFRNGLWFVPWEGEEYPAKTLRVEDFLRVLSTRAAYPVRASSAAAHERLGLMPESASRVLLRGGPGQPLLDLLIGRGDAAGNGVYLRKNGGGEVRSGEDRFSAYVNGSRLSWYDLRLFPAPSSGPGLGAADVQRMIISPPREAAGGPEKPPLVLTRSGGGWVFGASGLPAEGPRVESAVRAVIEAQGEDFNRPLKSGDPVFNEGSIVLELGDGSRRSILLGPLSEKGRRTAAAASPWVYELADWTVERLFRDAGFFEP